MEREDWVWSFWTLKLKSNKNQVGHKIEYQPRIEMNIHRVGYLTCSSHELMTILFKSLGLDKKKIWSASYKKNCSSRVASRRELSLLINTVVNNIGVHFLILHRLLQYSTRMCWFLKGLFTHHLIHWKLTSLIHVHKYFSNMVSVSWRYLLTNRLMKLLFRFLKETSGNPLYTMT